MSTKIIAVTNQKGGVGKTTTTINLAAALAEKGQRVLILDLDPQGNASTGVGVFPEMRKLTAYDILIDGATVADAVHQTEFSGISIIPATTDLSSADIDLQDNQARSGVLNGALSHFVANHGHEYEFILMDCPPSLNLLTVNALVACKSVLVPLQSEFFALEGLSQLMLTIREVREAANPDLRIEGIVLTMFDARNNLSLQVAQDARENLGSLVFDTMIPRNVRISEAPSFAMPVLSYDSKSKGSAAYRNLATEVLMGTH